MIAPITAATMMRRESLFGQATVPSDVSAVAVLADVLFSLDSSKKKFERC